MRVPRPVAGLPVLDPEVLAQAWLLALLADVPLARAGDVPVAQVVAEGPSLCAALLAALGDDAALDELGTRALPVPGPAAAEALVLADALDRLAHAVFRLAGAPVAAAEPQLHVHDRRESPIALVARALERHGQDGEPFALLLGEVAALGRWEAAEPGAVARAAAAVAAALRPGDRLVAEAEGRWWVLAPGTDPDAARELAAGLADAAEHAGPAGAVFGVAACPRDGVDAEALLGRADEALLAAQAAGRPVA